MYRTLAGEKAWCAPHPDLTIAHCGGLGVRIRRGASYIALLVGGMGLRHDGEWALYAIGAVALILLFVGIHNAWDTVSYMVVTSGKEPEGGV